MKLKEISANEHFIMNGIIFKYTFENGFKLHRIGNYDKKSKPKFILPTLGQVKDYFKEKGYNDIGAKKAWEYYEAGNWKDGKGNQVKNWKQKLLGVWMRDEYKIQPITKDTTVENFFQKG